MAVTTPSGHGMGLVRDSLDPNDYRFKARRETLWALPSSVDGRPFSPDIRNQKGAGACTAFAGAGAFDAERKRQGLDFMTPSPLFLYGLERESEGTFASDSGAQIRTIAKVLSASGVCSEADWPYDLDKLYVKPPATDYTSALNNQVLQYQSVQLIADQVMGAIAEGFEPLVGFNVYDGYERTGSDGMIPMPRPGDRLLGGHANRLCGYDATRARYHETLYLSANSWSESWGMQGYGWFPESYILNKRYAADFWILQLVESGLIPPPPPGFPIVADASRSWALLHAQVPVGTLVQWTVSDPTVLELDPDGDQAWISTKGVSGTVTVTAKGTTPDGSYSQSTESRVSISSRGMLDFVVTNP